MEKGYFEKNIVVTPDYCDMAAGLSPLGAFTIFQGIASEHAEQIGVGFRAMGERGEFWLTVHTRVDFLSRAYIMDELKAETWPEKCEEGASRCYRSYCLSRGDQAVAVGRTQWAILGPEKKVMKFSESGVPKDFPFIERESVQGPNARFRDDFSEDDLRFVRKVCATDIDLGRHMNNVSYVRVLMDCFSAKEIASGRMKSVEIHYFAPCLEGDELAVYVKNEETQTRAAIKREGKIAAMACVKMG